MKSTEAASSVMQSHCSGLCQVELDLCVLNIERHSASGQQQKTRGKSVVPVSTLFMGRKFMCIYL